MSVVKDIEHILFCVRLYLPCCCGYRAMARYVNLTTLGLKTFNGCDALPLTARQRRACRLDAENDYERMRIMARASLATVRECSRQFQDRRWNCSSFLANESQPLFGQHFIHTRESSKICLVTKQCGFKAHAGQHNAFVY